MRTLKINLLWNNPKWQSWAVSLRLCYLLKFCYLPRRPTVPFWMILVLPHSVFLPIVLLPLSSTWRLGRENALWLSDATFGNLWGAYPREARIRGATLQSLQTQDKNTRFIINSVVFMGSWLISLSPFFFLSPCIQRCHLTRIAFAKVTPAVISCFILPDISECVTLLMISPSKTSLPPSLSRKDILSSHRQLPISATLWF